MVYHECGKKGSSKKNTGAKEQCLVGVTVRYAVAIPGFTFPTTTAAKALDSWNTAIAAKNLIPLYDVNEYAIGDTEATYYEGKTSRYETGKAKKIRTFRTIVGSCSYAALSSYNEDELEVYEFTEDGYIKAVIMADGKIKGQKVKLNVGRLQDAVDGTPQSAVVTVNYMDFNEYEQNGANLIADFSYTDLYGIFDARLIQVSATSTSIKFKASYGCEGEENAISVFEDGDVIVKDASGGVQSVTFVTPDSEGVYEVTGTGFANDFTVELNGVVTKAGTSYESPTVLTVSGI